MNRFRSRKKSPGDKTPDGSRRPSLDAEAPPVPSFSSRTFKRKKQAAPEPKPELDLNSALPASDDFRTSLLMPNLSARFSMLREQDDPKSKLGKANDDSVLFPKRASRLDLFNRQGLSDIAEVDSVRGSIRPPFAQARTDSYGSGGYDTDEGSMISRSRPGEGNTMFGGRQKIYKIPVNGSGSVKNFGASEDGELPAGGNMGGKALYESDIATSAFQRLREEEKRQEQEGMDSHNLRSSRERDRSNSPPMTKPNRNRETSSSTNSGPSQPRTSTAATSVASQKSVYGAHEAINSPPHATSTNSHPSSSTSDRHPGKSRRLYGQGLDQQMYEQQSSALHRLESIQRSRTPVGGPSSRTPQQSRSASNLNERFQRGGPLYTSNGFRPGSPPPSATPPRMQDFDLGLTSDDSSIDRPVDSGYGRSPPLSPPMSPNYNPNAPDATLVAALEPNDLGKATASGAFNKPKKQYDEHQYLQRQLALQEGRGTPSPQLVRPFSPHAFSIDEQTAGRSRNNSLGSNFSRTTSVRQPWEHHVEDRVLRAVPGSSRLHNVDGPENRNDESFLNGLSGSEAGSESEADPNSPVPSSTSKFHAFSQLHPQSSPSERQHESDNNANSSFLQSPSEETTSDSQSYRSGTTITQQRGNPVPEVDSQTGMAPDSPTLGPVGVTNGLSGLVHQHLRNDSGTSSIYPDETSNMSSLPIEVRNSIFGHASALTHSRQQSRDEPNRGSDHWASDKRSPDQSNVVAPPPLSFAARHILEQATALRNAQEGTKAQQMFGNDKAQWILGGEAPRSKHSQEHTVPWQEQLKAHHARVGSTETQQEREDLANELAERRRMVQDNLRNFVEADSRSLPGAQTRDNSPAKLAPSFGILKKSSSRTSLVGKQERTTKAMKMLGIGSAAGSGSGSTMDQDNSRLPHDLFKGRDQFSDRAIPPKQKFPPQPLKRPQDIRQHSDNPPTLRQREPGNYRSQENLTRRASPRSSKSGSSYSDRSPGSRKNSNTTIPNAERIRLNGYIPNAGSQAAGANQPSFTPTPRPTDDSMGRHGPALTERSQSALSGRMRSRSNSKATTPGYPEPRTAPPGTPFMVNPSTSRQGPNPYSYTASSTGTLNESRPSISTAASSAPNMLPPQRSPTHNFIRPSNHRKRSVNKHDISEPTFISCTSSVDTVNLPEGASLSNGIDSPSLEANAPPIPVRDSRRKRTQTLLQALGRIEKTEPSPSAYSASPQERDPYEERSNFSADDEPSFKSVRQRLRKTSSEGGSMAQKARQQAYNAPSPAVPHFEVQSPGSDHVPYQAQQNVPAAAVMF